MIQQPTNYLPVQQAAVQQQMAQGQVPAPNKYSAIEINILGASVNPTQSPVAPPPAPAPAPAPVAENVQPQIPEGQKLNYMA